MTIKYWKKSMTLEFYTNYTNFIQTESWTILHMEEYREDSFHKFLIKNLLEDRKTELSQTINPQENRDKKNKTKNKVKIMVV